MQIIPLLFLPINHIVAPILYAPMQITFLRIDCNLAEEGLRTAPCFGCALNALTINN